MIFLVHAALAGHLGLSGAQQQAANDPRQACRADYESFCAGVKPGGGRIKVCLRQNEARLSSACRAVISGGAAKS